MLFDCAQVLTIFFQNNERIFKCFCSQAKEDCFIAYIKMSVPEKGYLCPILSTRYAQYEITYMEGNHYLAYHGLVLYKWYK